MIPTEDKEKTCEHLHWDEEGLDDDHMVMCIDCGMKGYIWWQDELR